MINKQYQAMSPAEQKIAHAGSFGKGLADEGISFLTWVKDVVEVASGSLKLIRQVKAHWNTPYEGSVFEWLEKADQTYREGEYKELVEALGFDPLKVNVEDFKQAWELALIIWDDEKCQSLLVQFTKDYYKAQHPLEASEFVGSAAFEVLLTILLILTTAGAGAVANVASKGRLVRQMNHLGDLFRDLARLKKQVYKYTPEKQTRSRSSGNMVEDLPEDDRPAPKASEPPKGEQKTENKDSSNQSVSENSLNTGKGSATNKENLESSSSVPEKKAAKEKKWNAKHVEGRKVYQRDDLFDPDRVDDYGKTNIERMQKGNAPVGYDGEEVNLHHLTQDEPGSMAELGSVFHSENDRLLHIYTNQYDKSYKGPDGVRHRYSSAPPSMDRKPFNRWKKKYWKKRANDFL